MYPLVHRHEFRGGPVKPPHHQEETPVGRRVNDQARALNADVFGFGEAIRRKYPAKSEQLLKNWENSFAQLEVELSVTAVVRSTGGATIPIAPGGMS